MCRVQPKRSGIKCESFWDMEIFASIVSTFSCSIKGMLGSDSGSGEQGWVVHPWACFKSLRDQEGNGQDS